VKTSYIDLASPEDPLLCQPLHGRERSRQQDRATAIHVQDLESGGDLVHGKELDRRPFGQTESVEVLLPATLTQFIVDDDIVHDFELDAPPHDHLSMDETLVDAEKDDRHATQVPGRQP